MIRERFSKNNTNTNDTNKTITNANDAKKLIFFFYIQFEKKRTNKKN